MVRPSPRSHATAVQVLGRGESNRDFEDARGSRGPTCALPREQRQRRMIVGIDDRAQPLDRRWRRASSASGVQCRRRGPASRRPRSPRCRRWPRSGESTRRATPASPPRPLTAAPPAATRCAAPRQRCRQGDGSSHHQVHRVPSGTDSDGSRDSPEPLAQRLGIGSSSGHIIAAVPSRRKIPAQRCVPISSSFIHVSYNAAVRPASS